MPLPIRVIACGNTLRRDDGAAHRVLELLPPDPDAEMRGVLQLTPELAQEMAGADTVVFIDADLGADAVRIQRLVGQGPVEQSAGRMAFTHALTPETLVALSRALYAFQGEAFVCRIPVRDVSPGEGLTPSTTACAAEAAREVGSLLRGRRYASRPPPFRSSLA